jgi:hypothetical protein
VKRPRLVLCSGATLSPHDPLRKGRHIIQLDTLSPDGNVRLLLENVTQNFYRKLQPLIVDLLELAAYVFSADCETGREGAWVEEATEQWSRRFHFVMPVREIAFWSRPEVQQALAHALNFLASDQFTFTFQPLVGGRDFQSYVQIENEADRPFDGLDHVTMFSGGLDSLAGAVLEGKQGEKLVLVSHRPAVQINQRQQRLFASFREFCATPSRHIPIWVNKSPHSREFTQRTRSFLFSALGVAVASVLRAKGVRFYENGVVSVNWPYAQEVQQSRASRTTHPLALYHLQTFCRLVMKDADFAIDNPFIFKTKAEIVKLLCDLGAGALIGPSCSCSRTIFQPRVSQHCGICSQCIERRIAILAAGAEQYEEASDYVTDVFIGARNPGYDHQIAAAYIRFSSDLAQMTEDQIGQRYSQQLKRAVQPFPQPSAVAAQFIQLHMRQAQTVGEVLHQQWAAHFHEFLAREVPSNSMLGMIGAQESIFQSQPLSQIPLALNGQAVFRRVALGWEISFEQLANQLPHQKGMSCLQLLLRQPYRPLDARKVIQILSQPSNPQPAISDEEAINIGLQVKEATLPVDPEEVIGLRGVRKQLAKIKEDIKAAKLREDDAEEERLEVEMEKYIVYLQKVTGKDGRPRKEIDELEMARQSVSVNIHRALRTIKEKHPRLYQHLKNALDISTTLVYNPNPRIDWITE